MKPKPKPKPHRKPHHYEHHHDYEHHRHHDHDRVDPSIRHGTLHGKYQRPHWMDHLLPSASYHKETRHRNRDEYTSSSTESSFAGTTAADSPEILTRWNNNFKLLNRKPTKKPAKKKPTRTTTNSPPPPEPSVEYSQDNVEDDTKLRHPYEHFDFNEQYYGDISGTQHEHHIYKQPVEHTQYHDQPKYKQPVEHAEYHDQPKYSTIFSYPEIPKLNDPFGSHNIQESKIKDSFGMPRYESLHASHSQSDFSPPHLLKITEDDIRKHPKNASFKKKPQTTTTEDSDSYLNWDTFQWTTPRPDPNVEHLYLRPTSSALHTMADLVSQEEFMPLKHQQYPATHHEYGHTYQTAPEADEDEETTSVDHRGAHTDFGMPMAPMTDDLYQSFTKRKNVKSGRGPIVMTMDR